MDGDITSRRAARRVANRQAREQAERDARQMTLDFAAPDGAGFQDDAAGIEVARPARGANVLDGTGVFARAAEERARAATARARTHGEPAGAAAVGRPTPELPDTGTADQWFEIACELEAESPVEARRAYHRALELFPKMAEAHINLGRSYHEAKQWDEAEAHYRTAAECDPEDPIVWFNLGVLLEDRGRSHEAIIAYRHAIQRDLGYGDAHYNLGLLLDTLGRRSEAITHLMRAREITGSDAQG